MMWSLVWGLQSVTLYGLYISAKIGQLIITALHTILLGLWYLGEKLFLFLSIILEDFTIFLHDVYQRILYFAEFLISLVEYVLLAIYTLLDRVFNIQRLFILLVETIYDGFKYGLLEIAQRIKYIFIVLKQIIVLFGDGVWFIIIYLPKTVASLGPLCLNYLTELLSTTFNSLKSNIQMVIGAAYELYIFVTDVPWEAFTGLIIAICFLLLLFQFYSILVTFARSKLSLLVYAFKQRYNSVKTKINLIYLRSRRSNNANDNFEIFQPKSSANLTDWNDNRLCVICQDRDKCIVILPCKHLCICDECIERQMLFNRTCPICRERIRRTMKIYL